MGLLGLVVGLLGLVVAPGAAAAQELPYARGGPVEGPAWWTECETEMNVFHGECNKDPNFVVLGHGAEIEATSIEGAGATFRARFQPMAGAPVTYWAMKLSGPSSAVCGRYPWCDDAPEGSGPIKVPTEPHYVATLAEGEIAGGNAEEYVTVTGSTSTALEPLESAAAGGWLTAPVELVPSRVYEVWVEARTKPTQGGWEHTEGIGLITAGTPEISQKRTKYENREEKKRRKAEERRLKKEEHNRKAHK